MDSYDSYTRSPTEQSRATARDRDDYRSSDPYRDRRRSPDRRRGGERDRDRRRSRSPAGIDRYQPSDRLPRDDHYRSRDDHARERRRSSPAPNNIDRWTPGMETSASQAIIAPNPLPDPIKLEYQVGFTWFAEWWRAEQRIKDEKERQKSGRPPPRIRGERETLEQREAERPKIQAAYDQYKEKYLGQQAQTFVRIHKGEDWFRERYVAEVRDPFRQRLMEFRKGLFARWERDLADDVFDNFTLEGIYKSESNGLGGMLEKEEGEASAAAEVLGVGDLLPSIGGEMKDPMALQPALLIKTVAPTVTREKFEAFAKDHLGEGEGGYQHLSLSDPNPAKKCHRIGWIMLHPEQEPEKDDDRMSNMDDEDGETTKTRTSTSDRALEKINGRTIEDAERGNFTVHCGVHRPPEAPRKKALWDLFSAPERIARDLELATRLVRKFDNELGDEAFGVAKIEQRVQYLVDTGKLQPVEPPKASKPDTAMDEDAEDGEEDEGTIDDDATDDEELLIKKKKLDLLIEYLRRVYNFCFFCVNESDSVHELQRKCPGGHLRRPRASLTSTAKEVAKASALGEPFPLRRLSGKGDGPDRRDQGLDAIGEDGEMAIDADSPVEERQASMLKPNTRNAQQLQRAFNWVKTYEEKVLRLLQPDNTNIRKLGGQPVEEGVDEELKKFVKQDDPGKYRCKIPDCTKLFKGLDFWRKHVEKRHAEWLEKIQFDVELVNTYVTDPAHIAPARSDANSNGHFPLGSNVPTGTPRNFTLNQHMPMGFTLPTPIAGGAMPAMPPGIFNPMTTGLGMGWPAPTNMGAIPGMGGIGPIRSNRANGYGNPRMSNPYSGRADGRGRVPSISGGRPGVFAPDSAGGQGPQDATLGRMMRTYEDLDPPAPEQDKNAGLDY